MLYSSYDFPTRSTCATSCAATATQPPAPAASSWRTSSRRSARKSKWLKEDDLLYPCTIVEKADKFYCYLLVTSYILPKVDGDWSETAAGAASPRRTSSRSASSRWAATHPASRGRSRQRSMASAPPPATCAASASSAPPATSSTTTATTSAAGPCARPPRPPRARTASTASARSSARMNADPDAKREACSKFARGRRPRGLRRRRRDARSSPACYSTTIVPWMSGSRWSWYPQLPGAVERELVRAAVQDRLLGVEAGIELVRRVDVRGGPLVLAALVLELDRVPRP